MKRFIIKILITFFVLSIAITGMFVWSYYYTSEVDRCIIRYRVFEGKRPLPWPQGNKWDYDYDKADEKAICQALVFSGKILEEAKDEEQKK